MQKIIDEKLIKFIIVGVINTVVGTAIMFTLYNLVGCTYWVSSATNYFLTSILSFFLNKYFTFKNNDRSFMQIIRFALNIMVCYLLAYGIAKPAVLWILSSYSETIQTNIAMFVGMCLFTGFNYLGQRFFAFK
jgi:putative flippase GtrA